MTEGAPKPERKTSVPQVEQTVELGEKKYPNHPFRKLGEALNLSEEEILRSIRENPIPPTKESTPEEKAAQAEANRRGAEKSIEELEGILKQPDPIGKIKDFFNRKKNKEK